MGAGRFPKKKKPQLLSTFIYQQIKDGLSNAEIMALNPASAEHIHKMDTIRKSILEDRYRNTWRDLTVYYYVFPLISPWDDESKGGAANHEQITL